ncbi:unnamed protein product [Caenorhabditis bovis]|uniref:Uncharacterized protein n=1 Tax=Caenorhabditis bovis TaxID=2654633 RepID=A0A8S1EGB4_9PELO|nr:unnamed protein product [Caenorhabditis bovis]
MKSPETQRRLDREKNGIDGSVAVVGAEGAPIAAAAADIVQPDVEAPQAAPDPNEPPVMEFIRRVTNRADEAIHAAILAGVPPEVLPPPLDFLRERLRLRPAGEEPPPPLEEMPRRNRKIYHNIRHDWLVSVFFPDVRRFNGYRVETPPPDNNIPIPPNQEILDAIHRIAQIPEQPMLPIIRQPPRMPPLIPLEDPLFFDPDEIRRFDEEADYYPEAYYNMILDDDIHVNMAPLLEWNHNLDDSNNEGNVHRYNEFDDEEDEEATDEEEADDYIW